MDLKFCTAYKSPNQLSLQSVYTFLNSYNVFYSGRMLLISRGTQKKASGKSKIIWHPHKKKPGNT